MIHLKKLVIITGTSAALAVLALTGCAEMNHRSNSSDRTAGRSLDDKMVTSAVKSELRHEPVYKFSDVDVKTFGGVVQLSGFVSSEEQKRRAGEIAQHTEGVSQVVNNITLKPNGPMQPTGRSYGTNRVEIQTR
jgi:hyperosmotically inducible protein